MNSIHPKNMSPYAPLWFADQPWWLYAQQAAKRGFVVKNGQMVQGFPEMIMDELIKPYVAHMARQCEEDPELANNPDKGQVQAEFHAKLLEYRHWVPMAAQYELSGKQIFDLNDSLVEMLNETGIGECTMEGWHAPYDAFYLHFGKQNHIKRTFDLDGTFEYLNGAFVAVTPWGDEEGDQRIKIGFTTVHEDGSGVEMPGYFLDLTPEEQKMPILEGFAASIERRVRNMSSPNDDEWAIAFNELRKGMIEEGYELLKQGLGLVVNALFYLESSSRSGMTEPGRDVPPSLISEWLAATPEKRRKLRSKISSQGYTFVQFMGKDIDSRITGEGGSRKAHWRRGHWRQQRHGTGLTLIKRVWIKPVLVNESQSNSDIPGHVYLVGNQVSDHKH